MLSGWRLKSFVFLCNVYRAVFGFFLGKKYAHMARAKPNLKLIPVGNEWEVFWRGVYIGVTGSWSDLKAIAPSRIFSIGSGPSILEQQFSKVSGNECVLVNGAAALVVKGVLPNCFAVMVEDSRFIYERSELLMALPRGTRLCLVASAMQALGTVRGVEGLKHFDLYLIDGFNTPYGRPRRATQDAPSDSYRCSGRASLSLDLQEGHFGCGTVMYCGIQLAFHLRVKELFLVGFDLTNYDKPRFYEAKGDVSWSGVSNAYDNRIVPALELVVNTAIEFDMKIFNCSHTSIVPRDLVPFSNILMS